MKPLLLLATLALAGFLALRALFGGGSVTVHQRLTLTIDTPEGPRSAFAVTALTETDRSGLLIPTDHDGASRSVRGEALALEVTPGRWLFLALEGWEDRSRAAQNWTYAAFPGPEALAALPLDRAQPLPAAALPLMLTFDDITDPATLRLVDPADLAASFGPGVRLVSVTLAITKARVTEGIIPGLPFWPKAKSAETLTGLPAYGTAAYPRILQTLPPTALKRD